MAKQKTIPELEAEKAENERKITQLQHKKQQLENRITYYEKGDRRKRAHHLITRGAAIESVAPLTKVLTETEFYSFPIPTFMSCVPSALWMNTADGATNSGGNICLMSMATASVMKQETMCSTLYQPPIGAVPIPWSIGGKHGLISVIRSLRKKNWTAGLTTAVMSDRASTNSPPSMRV